MSNKKSHGNADLVAHFFRRAFNLVRVNGILGLIATNTIAQGDTRTSGLRWICENGGTIYNAHRRFSWPGLATVVVSIVHISKGTPSAIPYLDGEKVESITAFMFDRGGHNDPLTLIVNSAKSFGGSKIYGQGFLFDDLDTRGLASPLCKMRGLLANNPRNSEVVFPYIGGREVNTHPKQKNHRYVINFDTRSLDECKQHWPELLNIVRTKVKPQREAQRREARRTRWWQFGDRQPALYNTIFPLGRVLANSQVSKHLQFAFLPSDMVYAHSLNVYPLDTYAAFCAVQSQPHETWGRFFGSSLEDRLRYTPSDCFETFPFPEDWEARPHLESTGSEYYEFRATLMVRNGEGMTKTYGRFHDPYETDPDIAELRTLHTAMDRAVLDTYGWTDIPTDCEFLLDYEIDEETWGRKKKPYRYRWPNEVRDEVLARLLELNAKRAAEEARTGLTSSTKSASKARSPRSGGRRGTATGTTPLWGEAP